MEQRDAASGTETDAQPATGDVCGLAARYNECGALVDGGTCWSCGAPRSE